MEKFLIKYSKKNEHRATTEGDFDDNMPSTSTSGRPEQERSSAKTKKTGYEAKR